MRKSLFGIRVVTTLSIRVVTTRVAALALAFVFAAQASAQTTKELTVVGRLTPTVEAGGWLIVADYGKYLILNARAYQSEAWFREGATVEATGDVRQDVMTSQMEGVPFRVRSMRARGRVASRDGAARDNGARDSGARDSVARDGEVQTGGATAVAGRGVTRVVVTGDATVEAQPDTAILTVAVVTQNASASEAQAENASKTDAVVRAVKASAGPGAEVRTSGYSLQPQYAYKEGAPPTITSYVVRNAVTLTTGALDRVGPTIDAASRAGANNVDGLSFTLRRDEAARSQALTSATLEAVSKARVVAGALGGRLLRVVEVQEGGGFVRPVLGSLSSLAGNRAAMTAQTPTPVESGPLDIRAEVTLVAEVETK